MSRIHAFLTPPAPLLRLYARRLPRASPLAPRPPLWTCAANRRRKNVGQPKNVDLGDPLVQLTAAESPWDDYLLPHLRGNSRPRDPARFTAARPFLVLGVETSCDDTAAAVLRSDGTVLGECRLGQHDLTAAWGGVVPHVARDAHQAAIEHVIDEALRRAGVDGSALHAVAATMGPGLEVCLRVGYRAARAVAKRWGAEFVAINHLEAHVLVARMGGGGDGGGGVGGSDGGVPFPFVTLLVSGGHCQLLRAHAVGQYEVLGGTLDDALGEAFDKTARLLGLDVHTGGGAALERVARGGNARAIPFPVPMRKRADCNFSFAGLKTSVRVAVERLGGADAVRADAGTVADVAASFQETAVRHVEDRVRRAVGGAEGVLVVAGGVAANEVVRARVTGVAEAAGWRCVIPEARLCTDNGVMVAWAAVERLRCGIADDYRHLDVRARWPLGGWGEVKRGGGGGGGGGDKGKGEPGEES